MALQLKPRGDSLIQPKIFFAVILLALSCVPGFLHVYLLDGLTGLFFGCKGDESTYYAGGYSDSKFRKVKIGMTYEEVHALLAEPLSRYPVEGGVTGWRYSGRRLDNDFRERVILFKEGKVVERYSGYYVD